MTPADPQPKIATIDPEPEPTPVPEPPVAAVDAPLPEPLIQEPKVDIAVPVSEPVVIESSEPVPLPPEPVAVTTPVDNTTDDPIHDDDPAIKAAMKQWKLENPTKTLKEQRHRFAMGQIDRLPWMDLLPPRSGFGTTFPNNPRKGDTYMRTDRSPNQLYKFNGYTWIEVDRNGTDTYTYDRAYIDHLIAEISAGRYNPDWLNEREADEIQQRIKEI